MEICNKYNINNSPTNYIEYNQNYNHSEEYSINPNIIISKYNKDSPINNNDNIYDDKLNNKQSIFQSNVNNNSSFKNPIINKEIKYNNDLKGNELNNQVKKAINLFFESKKANFENTKNDIERNTRNNLKDKTNENIHYMFTSNSPYKNIYEKESQDFLTKINQLSKEINHVKNKSFDFKNNMKSYEHRNKNRIKENSFTNFADKTFIKNNKKDLSDIRKLQMIIEDQRKTINELKLKQNNLQCILDKKDLLIQKLNTDIDLINNKFISYQKSYNLKLENLAHKYEVEKNEIINKYEESISKLKNEYNNKTKMLMDEIKEKENNKNNNEMDEQKSIINKLKNENNGKDNEKNELIKSNNMLKKDVEKLKEEINKLKKEIKINNDENEILKEIISKMTRENNEIKKTNDKLNSYVYGKFNKNK